MTKPDVWIVYDGECPVCTLYCRRVRLLDATRHLTLVDARDAGPLMAEITRRGWDIDEGLVVKVGEAWHYGSMAIHVLAALTTQHGWLNRLNAWAYATPARARINYAIGKAGRNLLLRLMRIQRIDNLGIHHRVAT